MVAECRPSSVITMVLRLVTPELLSRVTLVVSNFIQSRSSPPKLDQLQWMVMDQIKALEVTMQPQFVDSLRGSDFFTLLLTLQKVKDSLLV